MRSVPRNPRNCGSRSLPSMETIHDVAFKEQGKPRGCMRCYRGQNRRDHRNRQEALCCLAISSFLGVSNAPVTYVDICVVCTPIVLSGVDCVRFYSLLAKPETEASVEDAPLDMKFKRSGTRQRLPSLAVAKMFVQVKGLEVRIESLSSVWMALRDSDFLQFLKRVLVHVHTRCHSKQFAEESFHKFFR